jgi:glycosyltransferase involved in cell wall biosynthesis
MNILHVVAGMPATGSGVAEYVARLARETVRLGHDATIATVASRDERLLESAKVAEAEGVKIARFEPSFPRAAYASAEMAFGGGLARLAAAADIVHVHSQWTFPVWLGSAAAISQRNPLVMSPHGCLDPVRLAHSAWKKRLVRFLDRRCLKQADLIHATSEAERDWIRAFLAAGATGPRIEVVPIGVDLPRRLPAKATISRDRRVLFLGRLHPLKGLDLLLPAWKTATWEVALGSQWRLVIAGPDEQGTRAKLERLGRELELGNVTFLGAVAGEEKARLLADADLFVLPSRSENFGIVVAEALAAGVPVVTTTATPWGEIRGECGWCVEPTAAAIAAALTSAMRLTDEERSTMGERGRTIVEAKYLWPAVARRMQELYAGLDGMK